jgi:hypothetical protein
MKTFRLFLIAASLFVPVALPAQSSGPVTHADQQASTNVDGHLRRLTQVLNLSPTNNKKFGQFSETF